MAGPTKTLAQPTDRLQGLNYYSTHVKHYKVRLECCRVLL